MTLDVVGLAPADALPHLYDPSSVTFPSVCLHDSALKAATPFASMTVLAEAHLSTTS